MAAIAELRKKALEENPGYPVEFEDGVVVRLRSSVELSDEEYTRFQSSVRAIEDFGDNAENVTAADIRSATVAALVSVADNPELARERFSGESIALLNVVLKEYAGAIQDASKSAQPNRAARRARGTVNR